VAAAVPDRLRWAVETLSIEPGDHVLEIGCGPGTAASLVCERLAGGSMLAIDRSPIQIERARRRNAAHLGRLELRLVALDELGVADHRFDTIFVINVNLFWVADARNELARLAGALAPGGSLFLFCEAPGPARSRDR